MYSEDEDMDGEFQPDPTDAVNKSDNSAATVQDLPYNSKDKYNRAYDHFQKWRKSNGVTTVSQNVLMDYFTDLAEKSKPSTLMVFHSMLKATLRSNDNIDISSYSKLYDFLKRKHVGYKPDKSKLFTDEDIERFITEAPDEDWLDVKVNTHPHT